MIVAALVAAINWGDRVANWRTRCAIAPMEPSLRIPRELIIGLEAILKNPHLKNTSFAMDSISRFRLGCFRICP